MGHTMSIKKFDKIKTLLRSWLPGTIMTMKDLFKLGLTNSDIQKYLSSDWIESVGHGAYKKCGENVEWQGAIYGLGDKVHVGGKSALNLRGMAHYLNMGTPKIDLFTNHYLPLPQWFQSNNWNADIRYLRTSFLPDIAIEKFDVGNFTIKVSSPERAAFELMYCLEKIYSFAECKLIFENLGFLRSDAVQELLENCTSIKTNRLVLYFANSLKMGWYEKIHLDKINLGKGYRKFTTGGIYDSAFKIMIPRELKDEELRF